MPTEDAWRAVAKRKALLGKAEGIVVLALQHSTGSSRMACFRMSLPLLSPLDAQIQEG
jgi:hypothetical protein